MLIPARRIAQFCLLTLVAQCALALVTVPAELTWNETQQATAREIVNRLETRHYAKVPFDDQLSSQMLDQYLKTLDFNRLFLLASDIKDFEQWRFQLDDQLHKGDLQTGYAIFARYQQRVIERLNQVVADLDTTIANLDFTRDEYLELDRSKQAWPADQAEADSLWRKRIKSEVLNLKLAGKAPEEIPPLLKKRFNNQLHRVQQYSSEDVYQTYLNALTELYDPHTNYLSPRTSENFNINMSLKLEGIGAVLQADDEYVKVVRLVPAGPADKQGQLQPADRIVGVGEGKSGDIQDVVGWRLDDVVDLIRGPRDSVVRLEVIPAKAAVEDRRKLIEITRNEVKLEEQSAQKKVLEIWHGERSVKVGVIDVPAFYIDFEAMRNGDPEFKSTTRDVYKLLTELMQEGVEGVVIDLRNNGGGSLQEANALTGLFIDSGPTVQIRHSSSRVIREGKQRSSPFYDGPLVVLINRLSASASEIFAGAIQDYQRGVVIGGQSFGKGTVQSLSPLAHGQLKLTESKFYRISGDSTQNRGVLPDIALPELYDYSKVGEGALDNALPWDRIKPAPHRVYFDIQDGLPQLIDRHTARIARDPDFVYLNDQLQMLKKNRSITRLSLNEAQRRAQRDQDRAQQLAIENKRRQAKGLEPLATLDEDEAEDELTVADDTRTGIKDNDPVLTEAAHVLADTLQIYQQDASLAWGNR